MDYLDLLKQVLTAYIYPESADRIVECTKERSLKRLICRPIVRLLARAGFRLVRVGKFDPALRAEGIDWPMFGYTMIGLKRLDNVQYAIETVIKENIPGDIAECGAWRGGCGIFMRAVLKQHGISDRTIWLADSFEGLPKPDAQKYPSDIGSDFSEYDFLSVSLETVKRNFERFGLMDAQVKFLKGWFKDTLPTAPFQKLAVLRADGDLYESTMQVLESCYEKVSPGGFIIIDDYNAFPPCKEAVTEFRARRKINSPIIKIDAMSIYWRARAD
jgi:O-methyltransferase